VEELSDPQAAAGLPLRVKVTTSLATAALGGFAPFTWAVTVRVVAPSAGTLLFEKVTFTVFGTCV
jgi:hypothetical protein